jgi:hypothetical protein
MVVVTESPVDGLLVTTEMGTRGRRIAGCSLEDVPRFVEVQRWPQLVQAAA